MMQQAMQARKKMQQIKAVGSSGVIKGVVIDGLYNVVAVEVDKEVLKSKTSLNEEQASKVAEIFEKDIKNSMDDAKKHLEKEMSQSTSLEDLKGMLQ